MRLAFAGTRPCLINGSGCAQEVHDGYTQVSLPPFLRRRPPVCVVLQVQGTTAALDPAAVLCWAQAKRKYQEVAQMRKELEQDNLELQQKYQQKAMYARLHLLACGTFAARFPQGFLLQPSKTTAAALIMAASGHPDLARVKQM